jgi:hypothetical protein
MLPKSLEQMKKGKTPAPAVENVPEKPAVPPQDDPSAEQLSLF